MSGERGGERGRQKVKVSITKITFKNMHLNTDQYLYNRECYDIALHCKETNSISKTLKEKFEEIN